MKLKHRIKISFVPQDSGRVRFLRGDKKTLRNRLLRLLLGPCLHVVVVSPGNVTSTVNIHRGEE